MSDVIAGRFELLDPIAQGGSGVVWRALDRRSGQACALKVLRRRDAGALLRFVREQSVRLTHPRVLTPYSWAAEDEHVAIASELVDGGSLATLLGDYGPLAEPTVAEVLDQLLDGLGFVHAAGLVHRDVKPANLLLHASGTGPLRLRLSDFGLAVGASDARLTLHGAVVGTPGYLPPEALTGAAPDARVDLFAAGQVALALLAGGESDTPRTHVDAVADPHLRGALAALVSPDPSRRPASAARARALLDGAAREQAPRTADSEPVEVLHQLPDITEIPDAPRPRRRRVHPALVGGGVAAVLVAAGLTALFALRSPGHDTPAVPPSPHHAVTTAPAGSSSARETTPPPPGGEPGRLRAGQACTWQQQGDHGTATDGTQLVCTLLDGRYTWLPGG